MSENQKRLLFLTTGSMAGDMPALARRACFDVQVDEVGEEGLRAITRVAWDVIVAGYPFGKTPFQAVILHIRAPDSCCRHSGLVALAHADRVGEASDFLGKGLNRVVRAGDQPGLQNAIAEVLEVSPRTATRLLIRLKMHLGERDCGILTYAENVSCSGMLLGTSNRLGIGQQVSFWFGVPDTEEIVSGRAEVVRHTVAGRDAVDGIGIRFVNFDEDGEQQLLDFFDRSLASGEYQVMK